jgi:DNA-binding NtrC family response regulator
MNANIIYIDDNLDHLQTVKELFDEKKLMVDTYSSPEVALAYIEANPYQYKMLITDYDMDSMKGDQVTLRVKLLNNKIHVVVISGHEEVGKRCLESGADQFIPKFQKRSKRSHLENLLLLSEIASNQVGKKKNSFSKNEKNISDTLKIAGQSDQLDKIATMVKLFGKTQETVFIHGESGVGKERVARSIHENSEYSDGQFVAINCGAIPENLIESELFGHEKGAFTGADKNKTGKFLVAHNGTIFLDEIGDMPLNTQVKLLRVLQESEITPVGSTKTIKINVRVVTATHRDLKKEVANGNFREDLFYRINILPIDVPALRDRIDDIEPIAQYIVGEINNKVALEDRKFLTAIALKKLKLCSWPGNVRDLETAIKRAHLLGKSKYIYDSDIQIDEFSTQTGLSNEVEFIKEIEQFESNDDFPKYRNYIEKVEKKLLEQALTVARGNKSFASKLLKMPYTTYVSRYSALLSN